MEFIRVVSYLGLLLLFLLIAIMLLVLLTADGSEDAYAFLTYLGLFGSVFGFVFSVFAVVLANRIKKLHKIDYEAFGRLHELKEKGAISEEEFKKEKAKYLT